MAVTTTIISALGLSQIPIDWLAKKEKEPAIEVLGVGAVVLEVPPVAVVYHLILLPDAVSTETVAPTQ